MYIPMVIAPSLGYLFEHYMFSASGYAANRSWLSKVNELVDGAHLSVAYQASVLSDNQVRFHGWLLVQINSVGNKGKRQMFYVTFIAKYFGLSREGMDLLAAYGYGVTLDMFDNLRKMYQQRAVALSRYNIHFYLPHVCNCV